MSTPDWSAQQAAALTAVGAWLKDPSAPQVFRLFGFAGTGKTTLARHLAQDVRTPMFAAFTGKAASVLREKGCVGATTIHSLMYTVTKRDRILLNQLNLKLTELTPEHPDYAETKALRDEEADKVKRPWFYVNPDSELQFADLIIIDEVSMVDTKVGKDLESFGKKILVLGDPAQLPPIKGGGYFTNRAPDILLTEIHRQALDNPVLRWATLAREGTVIPYGDEGNAKKFRRERVDDAWLASVAAGQLLVGKNETRRALNQRVRTILGRSSTYPQRNDTLVWLQNDHRLGVLNGTLCTAYCDAEEFGDGLYINVAYDRRLLRDLKIAPEPFQGKDAEYDRGQLMIDFGYALTVHKAQGSQWETVTLYDDGFGKRDPEQRRRWLYTAITRAENTLNIVTS